MTTIKKNGPRLPSDILKIVLDFAIRDKYDFKILSRVSRGWKLLTEEVGKTKRRNMTIPEYIVLKLQRREYTKVIVYEDEYSIEDAITITAPPSPYSTDEPITLYGPLYFRKHLQGEWIMEDRWEGFDMIDMWGNMYGSWFSLQLSLQYLICEDFWDGESNFILESDTPEQHTITGNWDMTSLQKQLDDPDFQNKLFFL